MITTQAPEEITLYYKQGSSDKVYRAAIEPSGPGFVVNFAYGRRGSTLTTGSKTSTPVGYDEAKIIFDKLIKEKTDKGYSPGEAAAPYQHTAKAERFTGVVPQLLNPIDETQANQYIADNDYWAQEKFDGKRILIRRTGDTVIGINRTGMQIDLSQSLVERALTLGSQQWLMDGESVGDIFHAFDLLESACVDLRPEPYATRYRNLVRLVGIGGCIRTVDTSATASSKKAMLKRLRERNAEGIVFKRHQSVYTPGRPASGGDQLKLKFTASCSCIVAGLNSRRSIKLELIQHGNRIAVGNVTIPPNQQLPILDDIVEVRYLYAYPAGSLYQPVYLGRRDDVSIQACTLSQLKFKPESADE